MVTVATVGRYQGQHGQNCNNQQMSKVNMVKKQQSVDIKVNIVKIATVGRYQGQRGQNCNSR